MVENNLKEIKNFIKIFATIIKQRKIKKNEINIYLNIRNYFFKRIF